MWLLVPILLTLHVAVCLLLVLAILMQLPRSEGLGAAFGGGMTDNMFGAQTTNVLSKFTVWLGVGFFVLTLFLAMAYARRPAAEASKVNQELLAAPVPVEATSPAQAAPEVMKEGGATGETVTSDAPKEIDAPAPESSPSGSPSASPAAATP
jgi:preprotein translocase subunit SecG